MTSGINSCFLGLVIPSFFHGLWFDFWEKPIVVALFLLDIKYSAFIATINGLFSFALYAGLGFNNPAAHYISSLDTLLGVFVGQKIIKKYVGKPEKILKTKEVNISNEIFPVFPVLISYDIIVVTFTLRIASL